MDMKILKQLTMVTLAVVLLTACSAKDDEFSLDKFRVSIATVNNPNEKNVFFLQLDDSTLLWTAATAFHNYAPKNGQRVIANYTLLADKRPTGMYDYDVRLNDVYEVLTKPIFNITPATQDSIGNNPIEVTNAWIGSHFLNVEFAFFGFDRVHYINLVKDDAKSYDDGKIHLEFRHNARGDSPMYRRYGIVSFDISSLIDPTVTEIPLVMHVNKPNQTEDQLINFTFRYNAQSGAGISTFQHSSELTNQYSPVK
jgi:hypothetical protein